MGPCRRLAHQSRHSLPGGFRYAPGTCLPLDAGREFCAARSASLFDTGLSGACLRPDGSTDLRGCAGAVLRAFLATIGRAYRGGNHCCQRRASIPCAQSIPLNPSAAHPSNCGDSVSEGVAFTAKQDLGAQRVCEQPGYACLHRWSALSGLGSGLCYPSRYVWVWQMASAYTACPMADPWNAALTAGLVRAGPPDARSVYSRPGCWRRYPDHAAKGFEWVRRRDQRVLSRRLLASDL